MGMVQEFKKFVLKGNVVDLATGVIIGAAFGKIVEAFAKGIIEPLIKLISGSTKPDVAMAVGPFDLGLIISAVINFLIVAAIVFFLIVKPINKLISLMQAKEAAAPPPGPTPTEVLLTEIRDTLRAKA
ncbi:MAG: large conductance mechanosensitive channel protein MscL [Candidatus Saccharimonas sp.]|nr:large conductance mechanosensitive channel protein MscL [Planctomycetaceae bacterium]